MSFRVFPWLVWLSGPWLWLSAAQPSLQRFEFEQPHMGTTTRIVLYAADAAAARAAADDAFARIADLDARLSDYRDDSELMRLCARAGGPPVAVSEDLFEVLEAAQVLAARTHGAFDVTVGPVSRLWRRARAAGDVPAGAQIEAAARLVGYTRLELSRENRTARLANAGMLLDVGGIAKGYAADQAVRVLSGRGSSRALVALGGDVVAGDSPPDEAGWRVAVAPLGPAPSGDRTVLLQRAAVSSSGDAEQYLERGGVRYSHIVRPRSGRALEGRTGVTVRAREGITADGLATAAAVLGPERGLALVESTPGAAALFVSLTPAGPFERRSRLW